MVIRYFGGVKLGVSGLINAYKTAAKDALENTEIVEKTVNECYRLHYPYASMNEVMSVIKDLDVVIRKTDFQLQCEIEIIIRKSKSIELYDRLNKIKEVRLLYLETQ